MQFQVNLGRVRKYKCDRSQPTTWFTLRIPHCLHIVPAWCKIHSRLWAIAPAKARGPLQLAQKTPHQGHKPLEWLCKIDARAMSHSRPPHWLWHSLPLMAGLGWPLASGLGQQITVLQSLGCYHLLIHICCFYFTSRPGMHVSQHLLCGHLEHKMVARFTQSYSKDLDSEYSTPSSGCHHSVWATQR